MLVDTGGDKRLNKTNGHLDTGSILLPNLLKAALPFK